MGVCLACHLRDSEDDIAYDLNLTCTINKIKNKHGEIHATKENANCMIIYLKLMKHLKDLKETTKDKETNDLIDNIYDRLSIVMMPLGPTDFGVWQAFNGITDHPVFQSCDGIQWMKTQKVPIPPLLIFHQFFDDKSKQYHNSSSTVFQGQIRASVLQDPKTTQIYEKLTGKQRDKHKQLTVDHEFIQFVQDNWESIGVKWYDNKLDETRQSLKSFDVDASEIQTQ